MPLHLDSITNDSQNPLTFAWILQTAINEATGAFYTEDKKHYHLARQIHDENTGKPIGRFIFTLFHNETEKRLEVEDIDIILDNPNTSTLHFLNRLPASNDSTEYYEVEVADKEQHLTVEAINRYTAPPDIQGTTQPVRVSAFPFQLNVFDSLDAMNEYLGVNSVVDVGNTGIRVGGLSPQFAAPGSVFSKDPKEGDYSFLVGEVTGYENIAVQFGTNRYQFVMIWLDSALGIIPVVAGREVFDLTKLGTNKIIAMNAIIKADFADYNSWRWTDE